MTYFLANVLFIVFSYVLLGFWLGVMRISKFKEDYLTALGQGKVEELDLKMKDRIRRIEENGLVWDSHTLKTFLDYWGDIMYNPIRALKMGETILQDAREVEENENTLARYPARSNSQ